MNSTPPPEPAESHSPHMEPPPDAEVPEHPAGPVPEVPLRRVDGPPSPLGLVIALAGLILLCVSMLVPRLSIQYDSEDAYGIYGISTIMNGSVLGMDTPTVVLAVALLAAVGASAHRLTRMRWPARISAVGFAAFTAAFAYHPVTVLQQTFELYQSESEDMDAVEIVVKADNGVYLVILAVALLAASTFFMERGKERFVLMPSPPEDRPASGPGTDPAISVRPG